MTPRDSASQPVLPRNERISVLFKGAPPVRVAFRPERVGTDDA